MKRDMLSGSILSEGEMANLKHEIAWVLLIKVIVLTVIWFVWFSSPQDKQLDENHVAAQILSSNAIKESTHGAVR